MDREAMLASIEANVENETLAVLIHSDRKLAEVTLDSLKAIGKFFQKGTVETL